MKRLIKYHTKKLIADNKRRKPQQEKNYMKLFLHFSGSPQIPWKFSHNSNVDKKNYLTLKHSLTFEILNGHSDRYEFLILLSFLKKFLNIF